MRAYRQTALCVALPSLLTILSPVARAQPLTLDVETGFVDNASSALAPTAPPRALRAALPFAALPFNAIPASRIQRIPREPSGRKLWTASIVAVAAASFADAHSSWGKREMNGMLAGPNGRFGARGAAIKGGFNAFWIVSQVLSCRKNRTCRKFTALNLALTSVFAATAIRNYGIPPPGR